MATADKNLIKQLDEKRQQARTARRLLEPGWFLDLAYFSNQQWLQWTGTQLHKPILSGNRITVVQNIVSGVVRTELAKMTKNRPVWVVTPNSADEQDTNASRLAVQVMRYMWKHLGMQQLDFKCLEWSRIVGSGFFKCYWDNTVGDPLDVLISPTGDVLTDSSGKPMMGGQAQALVLSQAMGAPVKSKRIAQGDVKVEVKSPFQMFIDPIPDSFADVEWLIEESVKSSEYAYRRFGVDLKADTPANPGLIEARLMGAAVLAGASTYKGCKIFEYWCQPCKDFPNGAKIAYAQGKILEVDEKPFDPMPYVMLSGIPVPGRLQPMSVVELLRGPQTELNKVVSQLAENRNRIANPTGLASKQAIQDPEKFVDAISQPGGWHFYDDIGSPNALPRYLEAPQLPEYVSEEYQRIRQAIEDISGQHEVTNANVPPGVTAASAITLLQEADDTRLGPAITDHEERLGELGQKILKLVGNFYSDPRTLQIVGDDEAWEIFDFKGSQLRGHSHVEVQAGSMFPQSLAAKQAMIQDLMTFFVQSGNPPHGRQLAQFLRDAGMGASDRLIQEYTTDETQINRENMLLALGQQLPTNTYDNDQAHVDGHEEFEKQPRFQTLPPAVQQIHLAHTAEHRQKLQAMQQQQLQMELQMQGKVPPMLSNAAYQAQQDLSQLQGQQQVQGAAQQQGFQAAAQEQQQRQSEADHSRQAAVSQQQANLQMQQQMEQHHQRMQHAEELHQARLAQMKQQSKQGADSARKAA